MTKIVFLEVDDEDRAAVVAKFPDAVIVEGAPEGDALLSACRDAAAVSCFINSRFSKEMIAQLPALQYLGTRSVGYDHIDVDACAARGITVCNVPDYGSHVIAEHVFALLLSTLRHIPEGRASVGKGVFDYHGLRGMALRGKTIGIVGTGKIGRRVAQIAHGFGMSILATDQCRTTEIIDLLGVRYVGLDDLLRASDIVTLHVPDTPETRHMFDARAFSVMKPGAVLVNTARGALIDSHALLDALRKGAIAYALLDVLEHEKNFEENKELVSHPRVVATPHIGFYADDSMRNMYLDAFQSIEQWQSGAVPQHVVRSLKIVCDLPPISASVGR